MGAGSFPCSVQGPTGGLRVAAATPHRAPTHAAGLMKSVARYRPAARLMRHVLPIQDGMHGLPMPSTQSGWGHSCLVWPIVGIKPHPIAMSFKPPLIADGMGCVLARSLL